MKTKRRVAAMRWSALTKFSHAFPPTHPMSPRARDRQRFLFRLIIGLVIGVLISMGGPDEFQP